MANKKSEHILNTSSNLLGFCLIVLTSLKISKFSEVTLIDEFTGIACILLIASSLFSFLSIRSTNEKLTFGYEKIADMLFITALLLVFTITFMIAFSVIF
ncbi:MAG TPA: hypothetical protein VJY62_06825 [Bacteroidia bacterium]|nr:hypothetical protein [Bacteroidia bacterium]